MVRIARLAALLVVLAAAAQPALGDIPYAWRNAVVGGGGYAPNIIFSAAEKGLAYLRTDMGGAYRWDARAQRWIPLEDGLAEGSYLGVESLAADPRDPDILYLAAGMYYRDPAAILRSTDRGASWTITPVPFRMGGNEDGRGLGERLAIDPKRPSTLFFGSRHDGLWRSDDSAAHWRKVEAFPWRGLGPPERRKSHGGVSFVITDPRSQTVFAGVADPAPRHLFRSNDDGQNWFAVAGGPPPALLPVKAALDRRGTLYIAYATSVGPNGIAGGAVWKLDTRSGHWTDITPVRGADAEGGYMGLSLDQRRQGRLAVSSVDRWRHGDSIWLSNDGGAHWTSLRETSSREVSASPFLRFGTPEAEFGHWISGLAIDPFDSRTLAYTTGATLYRSSNARQWKPWVAGIEQTAIITLMSPTGGAPLISGFGDIAGFVHERLDRSPQLQLIDPPATNTNSLDYAGLAPNVLVRSFWLRNGRQEDASLAWSNDGGRSWVPLKAPAGRDAAIAASADGVTFVASGTPTYATDDRGAHWWQPAGLPKGALVVADKADSRRFAAIDFAGHALFASRDGARSFTRLRAAGLPANLALDVPRNRETPSPLLAAPAVPGELWLLAGGRLFRSRDFGESFASASPPGMTIMRFGLGKAAPNANTPAVYAFATRSGVKAFWRSTDAGQSWARINDDSHQWGLRIRVISGDPRRFGRVYLGTDGRGILYGDPKPLR